MNKFFVALLIGFVIIGLPERNYGQKRNENKVKFNQKLADELQKMEEIDQVVAYIPQGKYKKLSEQEWLELKNNTFRTNQKRAQEIFNKYGFVGFDLAGKKGSTNF